MSGPELDPVARPASDALEYEDDRPWAGVPPAVLERLVHFLPAPPPAAELAATRESARYGQPFPLSPVQRSLWPTGQQADDTVHIIPRAYRLRGSLDSDALARSLTVLIRRHEALRTTFALFDGSPAQMVAARGVASYRRFDLAELPPKDREIALHRHLRRESRREFDLARGPVLRVLLLRLADDDHVLSITVPLIAVDRWSIGLLWTELGALYESECAGRQAGVDPAPLQPRDVVRREHDLPWPDAPAAAMGAHRRLDLPHDREAEGTSRGPRTRMAFTLDAATTEALRDLARAERGTLFMVLLAGYAALLRRYSGRDHLRIGTPIIHRAAPEVEGIVGCLGDSLTFEVGAGSDLTFRELVGRARDAVIETHDGKGGVGAATERSSTAQTAIALVRAQDVPVFALLHVEPIPVDDGPASCEFGLYMKPRGRGLEGVATYRSDLFGRATIQRLLDHFQLLIAGAVADPDRPIAALQILSVRERRHVLTLGRGPTLHLDEEATIWSLFENQAARSPAATALEADGETRTYCELRTDASTVARALRDLGVGPASRVGVLVDRPAERVSAYLGVLATGAAFVPLQSDSTGDHVRFVARDASLAAVITDRAEGDWTLAINAAGTTVVSVTGILNAPRVEGTYREAGRPRPTRLEPAYVTYSAGPDGRSRGVVVEHRSVINRLAWFRQAFPLRSGEGVLASRASDDASLWGVFYPLTSGGRCVFEPEGAGTSITAHMARSRVAYARFDARRLRRLVSEAGAAGLAECRALRAVVCDNAGLEPGLIDSFYKRAREVGLHDVRLHSLYGRSETTSDLVHWQCQPSHTAPATVPIGRPIANARAYVVDPSGTLCPVGVPGEIWAGGAAVASGYFGQGDLTAACFFRDPFAAAGRVYRTGDSARWRSDGQLEYLGRVSG